MPRPQRLTRFGRIQAQLYVAVIYSLNLVKAGKNKKKRVDIKLILIYSPYFLFTSFCNASFQPPGFHLNPQFWHTFLGDPEPMKPVNNEKPLSIDWMLVEPHLGQVIWSSLLFFCFVFSTCFCCCNWVLNCCIFN